MDGVATGDAVFGEVVVFLSHFNGLADPHQPDKISYPLDEILLSCLPAVLAGAARVAANRWSSDARFRVAYGGQFCSMAASVKLQKIV